MPTTSWLKQNIIDWLILHDVELPCVDKKGKKVTNFNQLTKAFLIELSKSKPVSPKYVINQLAESCGKDIKVLWLPPAHCEFNAIELI